jgi:hypothetical protein
MTPDRNGGMFLPLPKELYPIQNHKFAVGGRRDVRRFKVPPACQGSLAVPDSTGTAMVYGHPERPGVHFLTLKTEQGITIDTHQGGLPVAIAQGRDAEVWVLQRAPAAILRFDVSNGSYSVNPLRSDNANGDLDPGSLALGPDGNLWFTDTAGGRIGRITFLSDSPDSHAWKTSFWRLAKGMHPQAIIAGHDGRMFFTLRGQPFIGSIQALPGAAPESKSLSVPCIPAGDPGKADTKAETAGADRLAETPAGTAPRIAIRKPTRAERRESQLKLELAAVHASAPSADSKASAPPGPEAAASRPSGAERLQAMHVRVEPGAVKHILERHGRGANQGASEFHSRFSTREGLLELLASALEGAEIGRELRVDRLGRTYTACPWAKVGRWRSQDGREGQAGGFYVVTTLRRDVGTGAWEHVLVTAFPDPSF